MHQMMVPLGFAVLQLVPWFFAVFHRYSYALGTNDVHLQTMRRNLLLPMESDAQNLHGYWIYHKRDVSGTEQRTTSAGFQPKLLAQFGACLGSCDNQRRHREGESPICRQERPECLL